MVKSLAVFGLIALIAIVLLWKNTPTQESYPERDLATPSSTPAPETLGDNTSNPPTGPAWRNFSDERLRINLQFPGDTDIKREKDGSLLLTHEGIHITFMAGQIDGTDTLNTLAEKDIDKKKETMGGNFRLIDTISPIAIGSLTGITYSSEESAKVVTYFYVPRGSEYLLITDRSDADKLSVSDNIIYSLILL